MLEDLRLVFPLVVLGDGRQRRRRRHADLERRRGGLCLRLKMPGEVSMQLMRFVLPPRGSFNTPPYWATRRIARMSTRKRQGRVTHATRQYESFNGKKKKKIMAGNLVLCWMCLQWKREVCNQNNPLVHITCLCKCTQAGAVSVQHIQTLSLFMRKISMRRPLWFIVNIFILKKKIINMLK